MQDIHVRVDAETAHQLQKMAQAEDVPISQIVRRAVRKHVQTPANGSPSLARAHEGSGRVR